MNKYTRKEIYRFIAGHPNISPETQKALYGLLFDQKPDKSDKGEECKHDYCEIKGGGFRNVGFCRKCHVLLKDPTPPVEKKCIHEYRQVIDPWSSNGAYGGGGYRTRFYCVNCLEIKSK